MEGLVSGLIGFVLIVLIFYLLFGSSSQGTCSKKEKKVVSFKEEPPVKDTWDIVFHSKEDKNGGRQYYTTIGNAPDKVQSGYSRVKIGQAKLEDGTIIDPGQYTLLFMGKQYSEGSELNMKGISFLASDPRLFYKGDGKVTVTFSFHS